MTTSCSSLIIILVLNIFFSISSFVSSRETRNDDVTLPELHTLVQQQAVTIQQQAVTIQQQAALLQTLQAKLTADESVIQQQGLNIQLQGVTIQQQAALLQTLQAKLTADENAVMHQQGVTIQTLEAKLTADGSTIQQQAALLQTLEAKLTADESTTHQQGVTIQQQAALLQTLQAKLTADESTVQQLQAKQSTMEARQNKNVAFTATFGGGSPSVNIGVHGIVKFNNVITNIGGAYNAATGIFTAPLAGTYAFFFSGQGDNAHILSVYMEVSKNGNSVLCMAVMEGNTQDTHDKGTCFALSHLNAGDQVSARENTGGQSTYINENHFTSFSGFLVQAD